MSVSGKDIEVTEPLSEGESVVIHTSPENVILSNNFVSKKTSLRNYFTARITCIMPMGPFIKVYLDCGFPLVAYITNESKELWPVRREGCNSFIQSNRCTSNCKKRNRDRLE